MYCTSIPKCLACGGDKLRLQLNLGTQALANNYVEKINGTEPLFPLAVNLCEECYHLQLTHAVDPKNIYEHYLYVSGTSKTGRDHFDWFAQFALEEVPTAECVLDIGCNDGSQLDYFKKFGLLTVGVDPAKNLEPISRAKGHTIYPTFFNEDLVNSIKKLHNYDIIVAQNSFAHNPDPLEYLEQITRIMKPTGRFFVQTSQAEMIEHNEFDTIYHEHINYFNVNSMAKLCDRAGLRLLDVVKCPIHGVSYIFIIGHHNNKNNKRVENYIALEAAQGLMSYSRYDYWSLMAKNLITELQIYIAEAKNQEILVVGYGAAAKGNTLLNSAQITLDVIIDDNPLKHGLFSPGMNIPIVGSNYLTDIDINVSVLFVPLAWNFYSEIKNNILKKRNNKLDSFLRYFPKIIVEQNDN